MRPFKMFFGVAIAAILFIFVARIVFFAFIIAAILSIIYAVFRRLKDFITYDRYGDYYIPEYQIPKFRNQWNNGAEPLFEESLTGKPHPIKNIQFIEAI